MTPLSTARKLAAKNADKQLTVVGVLPANGWHRAAAEELPPTKRKFPTGLLNFLTRGLAGPPTIEHNFKHVPSRDRPHDSTPGDEAVTIVLNPSEPQDVSRADVFCWNELPELLSADDLFDSTNDLTDPVTAIVAEDEDEDEDWEDDDEEYEDEEYEDEEYEDEDEEEEGEEEDDGEEVEEEEWEEVDDEEYEEDEEEDEEGEDEEYEDDEEGDEWEDDDEDDWEEEDED